MGDDGKLEEIEDVVLTWISQQKADVLEELYQVIPLTLSEDLKGKKKSLIKKLFEHFCSLESEVDGDGGLSTFLTISDFIKKQVKTENKDALSVTQLDALKTANALKTENALKIENTLKNANDLLVKVRNFKISGIIAGKGENKLSYTSLLYQIENGRRQGYSGPIICDAVIRAISPSNNLRTYLESKNIISVDYLLEILKSHFKEKDSNSVLIELSNAVQDTTESVLDFVIRLMCLREKTLTLSKEEKCPLDEENLRKRFFQSMFTGMRNSNIRVELRERCKNDSDTSDELLLKYVTETCAQETERNEKFVVARKNASVNLLMTENNDSQNVLNKERQKKNNPFEQIDELKLTHKKEMNSLRAELQEIKEAVFAANSAKTGLHDDGYLSGNPNLPIGDVMRKNIDYSNRNKYFRDGGRNFRNRCKNCDENNVKCDHCFKCGMVGHRSFRCNQVQNQKNE